METLDGLRQQALDNPTDVDAHLVLADALMTEGDEISLESLNLHRQDGQAPTQGGMAADSLSIPDAIEATERTLISAALQRTGGNRTHAAELLDISPRNLQYKIKQYAIDSAAPMGRPRN